MIEWVPNLEGGSGPMYERIAAALARDVASGTLKHGARLPSQRDLAKTLNVTVGTVSRALQEAMRAGLVEADGRRGTTISAGAIEKPVGETALVIPSSRLSMPGHGLVDLRGHGAVLPDWGASLRRTVQHVAASPVMDEVFAYHHGPGHSHHRAAFAQWMSRLSGEFVEPESFVVTNGAQHALLCSLLTICRPGDVVACEQLTYAGLKAVAPALDLKLVAVQIDEQGIVPDALERAQKDHGVSVVVCVPNLQNPTTATMSYARRAEIMRMVQRFNMTVIEDDVYGGLASNALPSLRSFDPRQVLTLTGISKTLGPGLRVGGVVADQAFLPHLVNAVRATSWMASPIDVAVAAELMNTRLADELLDRNRQALHRRSDIAKQYLGDLGCKTDVNSPHAWLELPAPWTKESFLGWSISAGIQVLPSDSFAVDRDQSYQAVRLSLTGCPDEADLRDAISRIGAILRGQPAESVLMA